MLRGVESAEFRLGSFLNPGLEEKVDKVLASRSIIWWMRTREGGAQGRV